MKADHAGGENAALQAATRLGAYVVHTPLLRSLLLDRLTQNQVLIKPECLQIGGSFKYRGALNKLLQIRSSVGRHVVAYSSGNHAIATAAAAAQLGWNATLLMPHDAPLIKVERTRAAGGHVAFYDRATEDRVAMTMNLARSLNAPVIPSFDDNDVIAGQSTVVLEMLQDARSQGLELDDILVPCGGGGLLAGTVLAAVALHSRATIHAVEPAGFEDMARSLTSGVRERNVARIGSICDSLLIDQPGEITFPIIARRVNSGIAVSDADVTQAMAFAFRHLKLVVEPGGAVALAALLNRTFPKRGQTIGIVLSGGNVDDAVYGSAIMQSGSAVS